MAKEDAAHSQEQYDIVSPQPNPFSQKTDRGYAYVKLVETTHLATQHQRELASPKTSCATSTISRRLILRAHDERKLPRHRWAMIAISFGRSAIASQKWQM
jgi:hypothetical protein